MFQKIKIKDWVVEVDVDETAETNKRLRSGARTCGCSGCKRFDEFREKILTEDFIKILNNLGIDYKKDIEISDVEPPGEDVIIYNGWYHAHGRLLEGIDCKVP